MTNSHYMRCDSINCFQYFISLAVIGLSGCIEPFELSIEQQAGIVSINGRITNAAEAQYVFIGSTTAENRIANPIGGAEVRLYDDFGNSWQYFEELPGTYVIPVGGINVLPETSYHIEALLPNGKVYTSLPEKMPSLLVKDSIYYGFNTISEINENGLEVSTNVFEVFIDSDIPQIDEPLYIKWEIEEAWELKPTDFPDIWGEIPPPCFYSSYPDPQRINLYNSLEEKSGSFAGRLMAQTEIGVPFVTRYASNVYQYAITEATYAYWNNVRKNIDQTGSIFDIPPALIRGNIANIQDAEELVFGYFSASMVKESRVIVRLEEVPFFVEDKCLFNPQTRRPDYPAICGECEAFSKNLILRPSYFPQVP